MNQAASNTTAINKEPRLRVRDLRLLRRAPRAEYPFGAPRSLYFAYGRNALLAALRALRVGPDDEVLLPAFHCVSLVEPVVQSGARRRFYGVDRQFEADVGSLRTVVSDRTRVIVVIHFFGFPQPLDEIIGLCASRGIVLIEDCAHALYSQDPDGRALGTRGALSLFSVKKMLPVVEGAWLVANDAGVPMPPPTRRPTWVHSLKSFKTTLQGMKKRVQRFDVDAPVEGEPPGEPFATFPCTARQEPRPPRQEPRPPRQEPRPSASVAEAMRRFGYEVDVALNDRRGAAVCAWIARRFDGAFVRRRRRDNYALLARLTAGVSGIRVPVPALPSGTCPWAFPVDALGRPGLDRRLRRLGVPAFTFGETLHAETPLGEFADAAYLSENLVQLPIHPDVSLEQIEFIADALRKATER